MKKFTKNFYLLAFLVITTSATALLAQPVNNDCTGAINMTMNPNGSCAATTNVVTTNATLSTPTILNATFCAPTSGNDDVWYKFSTGPIQTGTILTVTNIVATVGTATTIGYAVYTGTCMGLTQITCVASGVATTSIITGLAANTNYFLRTWTGLANNSATFTLCLQVPRPAPNCATNQMPVTGSAVTLQCGPSPSSTPIIWNAPTTGSIPIGYRIFLGTGTPAYVGITVDTSISIINLLPNTTYNWYVVPTTGNDATGCNVVSTFTTGPEPACVVNNTCATATVVGTVGNAGFVNSTTVGATISQVGELCAGTTGGADDDVWFRFTTDGDGGNVTIVLTDVPITFDPIIQVYSGVCGTLTNIGCADGGDVGVDETLTLTGLAPSTVYRIRVYGWGAFNSVTPTNGAFTLSTSGSGVAGALPISLSSFTAQADGAHHVVRWITAQEHNSAYMLIERSNDQSRFTAISTSIAAQGDKTTSTHYTWTDMRPLAGNNYYRLRSVDRDGQETVSEVVLVQRKSEQFGITSVYPSPTTDNVTVQFNSTKAEKVTIRLMDMTGGLVMQQVVEAGKELNELPIMLNGLQAGVYSVTVSNSMGVSAPVRFVKQ